MHSKHAGADRTGISMRHPRPGAVRRWWILVLVLGLAGAPIPAHATPPSPFVSLHTAAVPADTLNPGIYRGKVSNTGSAWRVIRESSQRLLEPDTRILRYTTRYTISTELANKIIEVATDEGVDPDLAFRLVRVESRFHTRARSSQGALGLTQLMPSTARALDRSLRSEADILDPRTNLRLGLRYLRTMIDRYDDVRLGLLAYNRGPGTVDRALRRGKDPENGYSRKVLGSGANRYAGAGRLTGSDSSETRSTGERR
ncbi:hypothetical protein BH23GEM3_BH23GEM3_26420 [soil metagenome]|nr:lytic transglycosylase domain-containing protein [Gemmatimonadota bacterium]